MIKGLNDSKSRGSLRHQIRSAARQVAEHRQAVSVHRAALGERLHEGLTSTSTLLFAAGTGFVIGEFTGRAECVRDSNGQRVSRRPSMAGARKALRFALEMFGFAYQASRVVGAEPHHRPNRTSLPSA